MFKLSPKYKRVSSLEISQFYVYWVRAKEPLKNRTRKDLLPRPPAHKSLWLRAQHSRWSHLVMCTHGCADCYFGYTPHWSYVPEQDCHIPSFAETQVQPLPRFRCFKKGATDAFPRAAPKDSACSASSFSVTALLYMGLLAVPVTIAIYKLPENLAA